MKILFLTNDYPPAEGGMETCAYHLSSEFKKTNDLKIIVANSNITNFNKNQMVYKNVAFFRLSRNYLFKFIKLFIILFFYIIHFRPNVIYINTWSPFGLPALIFGKILNINIYITAHGLDIVEPLKSKFHKFIMTFVLNNSAKIFCVSNYTKELVLKYCSLKNIDNAVVINNGILLSDFYPIDKTKAREKINLPQKKKIILTVARLTPRKGHIAVLETINKLKNEIDEIYYVIVGRGIFEKDIQNYIIENNLQNYVKLAGFIDKNELIYYYNACDVFVMYSTEIIETGDVEGFGVAYLEANACAKPVIAANKAGACDAVKNNVNGFLANNKDELQLLIKNLLTDEALYSQLSKSALTFVKDNFQWSDIAKKYLEYMQ